MTFTAHIRRLSGRCFYQLRQLRTVRRGLTVEAARTLVHAFIISRVDYCNSVFGSTGAVHMRPLQSVLNAAARLIVRKQKYDCISSTMRDDLHWLPVLQRYHYKLCLLVFKCLHGMAPSYLADQCVPASNDNRRERLRSASRHYLACPRTHLVRYGDHSFGVSGPRIWNQLPVDLRDTSLSLHQFTKKLKTVLFQRAYYT